VSKRPYRLLLSWSDRKWGPKSQPATAQFIGAPSRYPTRYRARCRPWKTQARQTARGASGDLPDSIYEYLLTGTFASSLCGG
jgi:hypothetical protein